MKAKNRATKSPIPPSFYSGETCRPSLRESRHSTLNSGSLYGDGELTDFGIVLPKTRTSVPAFQAGNGKRCNGLDIHPVNKKKEQTYRSMKTDLTSFYQSLTQCFFIDRALPTVDLQVSEGERAPSQGAPSGRSSAKKSFINIVIFP